MLQYRLPYYLVCCIAFPVLLASCATYTASNGKKYRQFAPVKDRMIAANIDTSKFIRTPFSTQNHEHKIATINNKRVVVDFSGDDVQLIKESGREYLIYFWNAYCSGTTKAINTLDSLNLSGKKKKKQQTIYIALNKPVGVTSTTDTKDRTNIISFLNYPKRVFPVGRLDKDSDGLILLTNDGDIVNKILRAGRCNRYFHVVKTIGL